MAAVILIGISLAGFMISGSFWVNGLEQKINDTQKSVAEIQQQMYPILTNLENETALANQELGIIKVQTDYSSAQS
jgi:hypothetical protein